MSWLKNYTISTDLLHFKPCSVPYILIVYYVHLSVQFNPLKPITEEDPKYNKNPTLKDRIHCLVAVLPANTVSMIDDNIIRQMADVRKEARDLGKSYNILILFTKWYR